MDFWGRLMAGLIAIIMITIYPLQYLSQASSVSIDSLLQERTKALSDNIRAKGSLDADMYENYMDFLSSTGETYDFYIEDIHPVTGDEITGANSIKDSFVLNTTNKDVVSENQSNLSVVNTAYKCDTNDKSEATLVNVSNKTVSTDEPYNSISLFSTHIHTDDCYAGHRHVAACYSIPQYPINTSSVLTSNGVGTSPYTITYATGTNYTLKVRNYTEYWRQQPDGSYPYGYEFYEASTGCVVARLVYTYGYDYPQSYSSMSNIGLQLFYYSPYYHEPSRQSAGNQYAYIHCGATYENYNSYYGTRPGAIWCPQSSSYFLSNPYWLTIYLKFMQTSWHYMSSDELKTALSLFGYRPNILPTSLVTGSNNYETCNVLDPLLICGQAQDETPICNQVVTSISATSPNQTIKQGQSIDSSALATYLDGHTGTVSCTVSGFNTNTIGTQSVTLTYSGRVDNAKTWGTKICTTTVVVQSAAKQCTAGKGHPDYDGTLSACPVCTAIANISANSQTFTYDGNHHELSINNASGYPINTAYDIDPSANVNWQWNIGPTQPGVYPAHTYVVVYDSINHTYPWYFVFEKYITIKDYVATMTATVPNQTIYPGGNIVTTANITMASGASSTVDCTLQGYNSSIIGTQTVYLVLPSMVNYYGNPPSCILTVSVKANLTSLTVSPATQTIERYTNPNITVTAWYQNNASVYITNYTMAGIDTRILGVQIATVTYTENGITKTATAQITVKKLSTTCPKCSSVYELDENDVDHGCPVCKSTTIGLKVTPDNFVVKKGDSLPITVFAVYKDGTSSEVTGWTSDYNSAAIGLQLVLVSYGGYSVELTVWVKEPLVKCSVCGTEYPVSAGKCPVCAETVKTISVNPSSITVKQDEALNLTVTANYVDGSSSEVTDWSIDRASEAAGSFTATITYKGATTTILLTIISHTAVTCPICDLTYEPSDSPKGCPVCAETVTGIEAYLTSGTNKVQYGSTPGVSVVLTFLDNHKEIATEGYSLDDFNSTMMGNQTIEITYGLFSTNLDIEVVNVLNQVTCPNGHEYFLNEDGSDPGCPICATVTMMNAVYFFDITYTVDILNEVYTKGSYHFEKGNFITIKVTKRDISIFTRTQKTFFMTALLGRKKRYTYGGEVF